MREVRDKAIGIDNYLFNKKKKRAKGKKKELGSFEKIHREFVG